MSQAPPAVLELLGNPIRWHLVRSLARSDLRVGELVEEVGERQNLVSYHLAQLRGANLVVERRSAADARDVYYSLNLTRIQDDLHRSASAVHPALRVIASKELSRPSEESSSRVLFICTGNSARSQMAEALLRSLGKGAVDAESAGPRPVGIHPMAVRVLRSLGLPIADLRSKGLEEVAGVNYDHVVTLCDIAREECPKLPGDPKRVHWSLPDPAAVAGSERQRLQAFRQAASELQVRIAYALPVLARSNKPKRGAA